MVSLAPAPLHSISFLVPTPGLFIGDFGLKFELISSSDRLLNNPYAEPPQPRDWEIRPTHPVRNNLPYFLAPLWDAGLAARSAERKAKIAASKPKAKVQQKGADPHRGIVPKELREKMKRARGAKPLLMDLENEVRQFVQRWEDQERKAEQEGVPMDVDSEDDEIVFVGRNGGMSDLQSLRSGGGAQKEMMIFDSLEEDQSASFGYVDTSFVFSILPSCYTVSGLIRLQPLAGSSYRDILWSPHLVCHCRKSSAP